MTIPIVHEPVEVLDSPECLPFRETVESTEPPAAESPGPVELTWESRERLRILQQIVAESRAKNVHPS